MATPEEETILTEEIELALEKAYRRGFHQALTLLATFYPRGITAGELTELANEHLAWRRELGESKLVDDSVTSRFVGSIAPLERRWMSREGG
jgi:hypothetical protein